jgi:acetyl esterase/lipase
MRRNDFFVCLLVFSLWLVADQPCAAVAAPPGGPGEAAASSLPADVVYCPGLTYRSVGKVELKLDLASPKKGKGPFPAVLLIHGGGWLTGDRKSNTPLLWKLAQEGYVAVSVSYRLAPAHPFPAAVHDVKAAVRWLRASADKYRIDPNRIAALGYSSGGHLACLLGVPVPVKELEGQDDLKGHSSKVQAVVCYYGITDLERLHQNSRFLTRYAAETFLGGTPKQVGDRYVMASPTSHVSKGMVPTLLIHGTADTVVPFEQSQRYAKQLKEAGREVEFLVLEGAGHNVGSGVGGEHGQKADDAALRFLDEQLRRKTMMARGKLLIAP